MEPSHVGITGIEEADYLAETQHCTKPQSYLMLRTDKILFKQTLKENIEDKIRKSISDKMWKNIGAD